MKLNILPIRELPGAALPFDYSLDLSDLELYGERPVQSALVSGQVVHRADMFELEMHMSYTSDTFCARCLKPLHIDEQLDISRVLVDEAENEDELDEEDILLLDDGCVDLDEVAREAVIFNAEISYLCSPDCLGLCPVCGHDLNLGPCSCKPEPDERLAALAALLDKKD